MNWQDFLAAVAEINGKVNDFVWVTLGLVLLLGTGVVMTVLTRGFQVVHIGHWFKETLGSLTRKNVVGHTREKGSISQFQALCTALAATVGVGNIAGVATAIAAGGPGAIFWMWLAAFLGMMTNFSENVLGIYYRRKNQKGEWSGGAMYYLQDGLGGRKNCRLLGRILAIAFSCFAILASFGIGNAGQINTIASNMDSAFGIPSWVSGLVLMALAGLVVIGGIKRIAAVAEKVVPFMVVLYLLGSLTIILCNAKSIGPSFAAIFQYAFGFKAVAGGAAGAAVRTAVTWGCKRGVFSNEAGLGSSVMVHSSSNVKEPVRQGMWGVFEVFADTMVVCTLTALVVLTSGLVDLDTGVVLSSAEDSVLVAEAFGKIFGDITLFGVTFNLGATFIALAILLFAFTTTLGWSYYGTKAWEYLFGTKATVGYKIVFVAFIMVGATMSLDLAWDISDTFNGLMMIPNLIGVLALSPVVVKITRNYLARKLKGRDETPLYNADPVLQAQEEARTDGE